MITTVFKILPFPFASPLLLLALCSMWILIACYSICSQCKNKTSFRLCVTFSKGIRLTAAQYTTAVYAKSGNLLHSISYDGSDWENRCFSLALPPSIPATSCTHFKFHYVATREELSSLFLFCHVRNSKRDSMSCWRPQRHEESQVPCDFDALRNNNENMFGAVEKQFFFTTFLI